MSTVRQGDGGKRQKTQTAVRLCMIALLCLAAVASYIGLRSGGCAWLLYFLRATCVFPREPLRAFGRFHLVSLAVCVAAAVLAGICAWKYGSERRTDRSVFACGVIFFLLEWYKQLISTFVLGNGTYDFSAFPFQFCSLPIYVCLIAPMTGKRVRRTCYCFLSLFGTVGGYLVMGYPNLPSTLTMSLHSMLWHTLMIALGVWLLIAEEIGKEPLRDLFPAAALFLVCFGIATILNIALNDVAEQSGSVLNLYYMSPYRTTNFLLVRDARALWGWGASALVYVLLFFTAGALPILCLGMVFCLIRKKTKKKAK